MSLAKLISLLSKRALYFSCITSLRSHDRHEGTIHPSVTQGFEAGFDLEGVKRHFESRLGSGTWEQLGNPTTLAQLTKVIGEGHQPTFFASCWHIAESESVLMWNRYAPGFESIAIETTVGDLIASLSGIDRLRAGIVRYDPGAMAQSYGTGAECFYKHPIFDGEKEFRVLTHSDNPDEVGRGMTLNLDLQQVIKQVYVSPDAEDWFADLTNALLRDAGIEVKVIRTSLKGA